MIRVLAEKHAGLPLVVWVMGFAAGLWLVAHRAEHATWMPSYGRPSIPGPTQPIGPAYFEIGGQSPGPPRMLPAALVVCGAIGPGNALGFAPPLGLPLARVPINAVAGGPIWDYLDVTTEEQATINGDIEVP